MNKIRIVIADDEELFRKGVVLMLEQAGSFDVIFEASSGDKVVEFIKTQQILPDIILMDLKMPVLTGVEATKIIRKDYPSMKIIALTSYHSAPYIHNMLQCGAAGFMSKNSSPETMIDTIEEVYRKGFSYSEDVLTFINDALKKFPKRVTSRFDKDFLTKRELEILHLICKQYTASEIAKKLFISARTVEGHRNNLLLKTDSKNIISLVIYALENKLVSIEQLTKELEIQE